MQNSLALKFNRKIRNRLLLLILSVAAVVLVLLAFVTYQSSYELLHDVIEEKSNYEVEIASQKIRSWIDVRRSAVQVLAQVEARSSDLNSYGPEYLHDVAREFGAKSVYLGTAKGDFISSNRWEPPVGWDPTKRPWYTAAVESRTPIVTQPYIDDIPPYQSVISIAAAVRSRGEVLGVVAMDVPFDSVLSIVHDLRIGRYSQAFLLYDLPDSAEFTTLVGTQNGAGVSAELLNKFLASGERLATYVDHEYRVFARVPNTGLILVFHLPISEVNHSLWELKIIFLTGIVVALLVLAIAVSGVSTLIARPILSLAEGANQVAAGNYDYRLPIGTRDELGLVTFHFNDMAEGLKERETIRSTFGRYVSPEAVQEILDGNTELGGEKKLVTVLFCDLRNFTPFAESCDPEQLVETLNAYFSRMDHIIRKQGGSINRYLGDGILALFGAPIMLENSAQASIEAALAMQQEVVLFNEEHDTNFELGIGIHTGVAIVGNIGSEHHTEYTVIGNVANLASRIEALTKVYGESILVSEASSSLLPSGMFDVKLIDKVRAAGKQETVTLYAPYIRETLAPEITDTTRKIIESYLQGNFTGAATQILALDDTVITPHLELILSRCQEFSEQSPIEWDGAYTFDSK